MNLAALLAILDGFQYWLLQQETVSTSLRVGIGMERLTEM